MPFLKLPKERDPLWKAWDHAAQKKGLRHTVYSVNGNEYTGEWLDNKKDGKGTYLWKATGYLYDGDWKKGKRSGFGTLSYPSPTNRSLTKEYSGGWKHDLRHGYGTQFYTDDEYYEGEWYGGNRSGWGRMYYADGVVYEGEWYDDQRSGQGMLRLGNNNRYEGCWREGKKNGSGNFYHLDTGQVFEGVWVDDIPKCGTMRDINRANASVPTQYPIPPLELMNMDSVIEEAMETFLRDND